MNVPLNISIRVNIVQHLLIKTFFENVIKWGLPQLLTISFPNQIFFLVPLSFWIFCQRGHMYDWLPTYLTLTIMDISLTPYLPDLVHIVFEWPPIADKDIRSTTQQAFAQESQENGISFLHYFSWFFDIFLSIASTGLWVIIPTHNMLEKPSYW